MSTKTVLFGEKAAGVYQLTDIYDPEVDLDGIDASGKIVPAVGSLIVDNTKGLHNQLYTVVRVDQTTYKSYLIPATFVVDSSAQADRLLSYGNDIFMLYFSLQKTPIHNNGVTDNVQLTRLIVDNKLSLFGNHAATYQLVKINPDGSETVISRWYNASNQYTGPNIPMLDTGVDGVRKCDGCYTDSEIEEGDPINCNIYSASGLLIATIKLIAKEAHFLNENASTANPIIGFEVSANQMEADGDLYLYQGQDVSQLAIFTSLIYSDGTRRTVAIDNRRGFVYGLDDINSSVKDTAFQILVKYYLSNSDLMEIQRSTFVLTQDQAFVAGKEYYTRDINESGTVSYVIAVVNAGDAVAADTYYEEIPVALGEGTDGVVRYISKLVNVNIISSKQDLLSKVALIPQWTGRRYDVKFLRYRVNRNVSPNGNAVGEEVSIANFDGQKFNEKQTVTLTTMAEDNGTERVYTQDYTIELRPWQLKGTNFLISDEPNSEVIYGDNTGDHIRPFIKRVAAKTYQIPSTEGGFEATTSTSKVDIFLDNFYFRANPPKAAGESKAPTPTHFIVKTPTGTSLMTNRLRVEDFDTRFELSGNDHQGEILVVEFYRDSELGTEILYGVPVDVVQ